MHALLIRNKKRRLCGRGSLLLVAIVCGLGYATNALGGPPTHTTHTVAIEAMQFSPQVLEVRLGDTVEWINRDPFPHNATAIDQGFQSQEIATNGSWKFEPVKKGTFNYVCTLHPTMTGTLMVK